MAIRLGDVAPDFTAETTDGTVTFHDWKAGSWAVLFSHPADFTPVCTTELGRTAALQSEFAERNTKAMALSIDPIEEAHFAAREQRSCAAGGPLEDDLGTALAVETSHRNDRDAGRVRIDVRGDPGVALPSRHLFDGAARARLARQPEERVPGPVQALARGLEKQPTLGLGEHGLLDRPVRHRRHRRHV